MLAIPLRNSFEKQETMLQFKHVHDTGTQAILSQYMDGWRINLDLREVNHNPLMIVGYLQPTLKQAKQLADREILKHGHVCTAACKDWVEVR
jgi:hypothetical protein